PHEAMSPHFFVPSGPSTTLAMPQIKSATSQDSMSPMLGIASTSSRPAQQVQRVGTLQHDHLLLGRIRHGQRPPVAGHGVNSPSVACSFWSAGKNISSIFEVVLSPVAHQEADELAGERAPGPELEARLNLPRYGDRNGHGGKHLC